MPTLIEQLVHELSNYTSRDFEDTLPKFAELLAQAARGNLSASDVERRISEDHALASIFRALIGRHVVIGDAALGVSSQEDQRRLSIAHINFQNDVPLVGAVDRRQGVFIGEGALATGMIIGVNYGIVIVQSPEIPLGRTSGTTSASRNEPGYAHHQLQSASSDFIGREDEVQRLIELLSIPQLVPITPIVAIHGMGGVGKSELARYVGTKLTEVYPDAQLFLRLQGSEKQGQRTEADALRDAVQALRPEIVLPDTLQALTNVYRTCLHKKRALIVLDDVGGAADIEYFLPPPGCALLITSRHHISLRGKISHVTLRPFRRSVSRDLFLRIAPHLEAHKDFEKLLNTCYDLPLALRVVAANLAESTGYTPERYLLRLSDEKHRSKALGNDKFNVYMTLGTMYELLADTNHALAERWKMLHVCPVAFPRLAVAALWNEGDDYTVDDQLARLVRHSLIQHDTKTDLFTIHDFLRDIARQYSSDNDVFHAKLRHARHYMTCCAEYQQLYCTDREGASKALQLFDASWEHVNAAIQWLITSDAPETNHLYSVIITQSSLLDIRLLPSEAVIWWKSTVAAAVRLQNQPFQAYALLNLTVALLRAGDTEAALDCCQKSHTLFVNLDDQVGRGHALFRQGQVQQHRGMWEDAEQLYRDALRIFVQARQLRELAAGQSALGLLLIQTGSVDEAIELLRQAEHSFFVLGDEIGGLESLSNLSYAHLQRGDYQQSLQWAAQQLQIAKKQNDRVQMCNAQFNIGATHFQAGNFVDAEQVLLICLADTQRIGYIQKEMLASQELAGVYLELDDYTTAIEYLQRALDIALETQDQQRIGFITGNAGILFAQRAQYHLALACYNESLRIALALGDQPTLISLLGNIADLSADTEQREHASALYRQGILLSRQMQMPLFLFTNLHSAAELCIAEGNFADALVYVAEAKGIADKLQAHDLQVQIQVLWHYLSGVSGSVDVGLVQQMLLMLLDLQNPEAEAEVYYYLWKLDATNNQAQIRASHCYRELYNASFRHRFRQRYMDLTGHLLSEPPPLPTLRGIPQRDAHELATFLAETTLLFDITPSLLEGE